MVVALAEAPALSEADNLADHIGVMLRVTARLAFAMLLLAYIARPIAQPLRNRGLLLQHRRSLGLAAALVKTVHFGYVWAFVVVSGETLEWLTVILGGAAFVLLWVMAATSSNYAQGKFGLSWRRLHLFGIHYVWLIFMQTFIGTAVSTGSL